MRITIVAVGRGRRGAEQDLFDHYCRRLPWPVRLIEVDERRPLAGPERRASEARLLAAKVPAGAITVALDEHGRQVSSTAFADLMRRWREDGTGDLAFLIGGADGLGGAATRDAHMTLSLGAMTWPHLLVRAMLAEQLYRANAILTGHPYHRGAPKP